MAAPIIGSLIGVAIRRLRDGQPDRLVAIYVPARAAAARLLALPFGRFLVLATGTIRLGEPISF